MKCTLEAGAYIPERAHKDDAGADLRTPVAFTLRPHCSVVIDFGVAMQIPPGHFGMLAPKSGLNINHNIQAEIGVVDSGFTGTIKGRVTNQGDDPYRFERGDKVMQIVIISCVCCDFHQVKSLDSTERGTSGYGSTGR